MKNRKNIQERPDLKEVVDGHNKKIKILILHNDDVHSFEYVIETLIDVCNHSNVQAEQCTFIVHYKGKCDVKKGSLNELKPIKEELINRGLKATID